MIFQCRNMGIGAAHIAVNADGESGTVFALTFLDGTGRRYLLDAYNPPLHKDIQAHIQALGLIPDPDNSGQGFVPLLPAAFKTALEHMLSGDLYGTGICPAGCGGENYYCYCGTRPARMPVETDRIKYRR